MSDVELRPARADRIDGERFARYLDEAADGFFRALLGRRSVEVVAEAFLEPGHDLSFERVTFAETSDGVAGMLSGFTAAQHAASSEQPLIDAAGWRRYRMAVIGLLASRIVEFINRVDEGDWYIQAVAVDPEHRGAGIGSVLLDEAERLARGSGSQRIILDVAVGNEAARRLYERRGMVIEATSRPILFVPSFAVHRMAKPL